MVNLNMFEFSSISIFISVPKICVYTKKNKTKKFKKLRTRDLAKSADVSSVNSLFRGGKFAWSEGSCWIDM
jgi:hypothetical protein